MIVIASVVGAGKVHHCADEPRGHSEGSRDAPDSPPPERGGARGRAGSVLSCTSSLRCWCPDINNIFRLVFPPPLACTLQPATPALALLQTLMGHEYVEMRNTAAAIEAYRSALCRPLPMMACLRGS